jgi:hypothetical protein
MRTSTPSTVRGRDRPHQPPSFAAIAGVAGVLAAGLIRDNLQAHLALACAGEQPPSSTPTPLPVRTISTTNRTSPRRATRPSPNRSSVSAVSFTVGACLLAREGRSGARGPGTRRTESRHQPARAERLAACHSRGSLLVKGVPTGIAPLMRVPWPERALMVSDPPSEATRSRMLRRPAPASTV